MESLRREFIVKLVRSDTFDPLLLLLASARSLPRRAGCCLKRQWRSVVF